MRMPELGPGGRPQPGRHVLVYASPPTPNGDVHLGHLAGPYLAADVHARFLRLCGAEAHPLCHCDENESYLLLKGEQMGMAAAEVADLYGRSIAESFALARVDFDVFMRPNQSRVHQELVHDFFRRMVEQGVLFAREMPVPFCDACGIHLCEAYVHGRCPYCGDPADAFVCEGCSHPLDCADLIDPLCRRCGAAASRRPLARLFLPLDRFEQELRQYYGSRLVASPRIRSFCDRALAGGLPDIAVTLPLAWGTPVPVPGFAGQVISGPFETVPGYLAATQEMLDRQGGGASWQDWWLSPDAEVVQFFGCDNIYHFTVLQPALMLAYDRRIQLPRTMVTNEFYRLDDRKFSTARRHSILVRELVVQTPLDAVRFHLAWSAPEAEPTNFTLEELEQTLESELVAGWEAWLADLHRKVTVECSGLAPAAAPEERWTREQRDFHQGLPVTIAEMERAYQASSFSLQRASRLLCELVRTARRFGKGEEPWRGLPGRREERATGIALELLAAKTLAFLAAPLMPGFAEHLWERLGASGALGRCGWERSPSLLPAGARLGALDLRIVPHWRAGKVSAVA